jgi:hypothetical protein
MKDDKEGPVHQKKELAHRIKLSVEDVRILCLINVHLAPVGCRPFPFFPVTAECKVQFIQERAHLSLLQLWAWKQIYGWSKKFNYWVLGTRNRVCI